MINNHKIFSGSNLKHSYKMPITLVSLGFWMWKWLEIIYYTGLQWSFFWHIIRFVPHIFVKNDRRCYRGSELVSRVWETYRSVDTKNTFLRYLEGQSYDITMRWRPFWILPSSGKRTMWIQGVFNMLLRWWSIFPIFHFSPNFTGLFAKICLEIIPNQNFGETTACATILL